MTEREYEYLSGRKELFIGAPADAMVVLEHEDGEQVFFAVAHQPGATYWNSDGTPGRRVGLISLLNQTRVIASRRVKPGSTSGGNQRQPVRVPVQFRPTQDTWLQSQAKKQEIAPADPAPAKHFTSMFELPPVNGVNKCDTAYLSVYSNGSFKVSKVVASEGDTIDLQINLDTMELRIGKVKTGGKTLGSKGIFTCVNAARSLGFVNKRNTQKKRITIPLTQDGDWFYGQFDSSMVDIEGGQ